MPYRTAAGRLRKRGFTLTELLVAVIAGMLVAAAAFSFSKQVTRFFAQEARVASAQMSVLAGFQRLQSDIALASHMMAPNLKLDVEAAGHTCAPDYSSWPAIMKTLTGVRVTVGGSQTAVAAAGVTSPLSDGKYPDTIRIAGNLVTPDWFPVDEFNGSTVYLEQNRPAFARNFSNAAEFKAVFKPGRILHVYDYSKDRSQYLQIVDSKWEGGRPSIITKTALISASTDPCGIAGYGSTTRVNPISIVEYGLAKLSGSEHPAYADTIYASSPGGQPEVRTELVRREILIGVNDNLQLHLDPATEIVAEFAVDLRFGAWVDEPGKAGLTYLAPSTPALSDRMLVQTGTYTVGPTTGPETIRSLSVRLVVRSREVDRSQDLPPNPLDGGFMHRYSMGDGGAYARARTLLADVALMNQRGLQ